MWSQTLFLVQDQVTMGLNYFTLEYYLVYQQSISFSKKLKNVWELGTCKSLQENDKDTINVTYKRFDVVINVINTTSTHNNIMS